MPRTSSAGSRQTPAAARAALAPGARICGWPGSFPLLTLTPGLSLKRKENPWAGVLERAVQAYQGNP